MDKTMQKLQNLICVLFIFADQIFIDSTFFGIFVCGPLQSFVVNSDRRRLIKQLLNSVFA